VGIGSAAVGDGCTVIADCAGGQGADCITEYWDFRGGYCISLCSTSEPCGAGNHCSFIGTDGYGSCMKDCAADGDCRSEGYGCYDADDDGTSECHVAGTGPGAVGDPCEGTWDCGGGRYGICALERDGWPDGYCTIDCTPGSGTTCPGDGNCTSFGEASYCLDGCTGDGDCRSDYHCTDADGSSTDECFPI